MASAAKRADRETSEGKVGVTRATTTSARSSRSAARPSRSRTTTTSSPSRENVLREPCSSGGDAVRRSRTSASSSPAKLGENIQVVGARRMEAADGEVLSSYVHPPANKVGALVRTKGGDARAAARSLALHIDVRAADVRHARRGAAGARRRRARDPRRSSDEVLVEAGERPREDRRGQLNKRFYAESVLDEQTWYPPTSRPRPSRKALDQRGLELLDYAWYSVG